jgi:pilus assembly protein CpaC
MNSTMIVRGKKTGNHVTRRMNNNQMYLTALAAVALVCAPVLQADAQEEAATSPTSMAVQQVTDAKNAPIVVGSQNGIRATVQSQDFAPEVVSIPIKTSKVLDINVPVKRVELASPEIASVSVLSPMQLLVSGLRVGTTQLIIWGDDPDSRLLLAVTVEPNLEQLRKIIKRSLPYSNVEVEVVNDVIVLSGLVATTDDARRVMELATLVTPKVQNQLRVAGEQQVLLRCTVAEVSKSATRELGIDAWASFEDNSPRISALNMSQLDPTLIGPIAGMPGVGGTAFFGNRFLFGSDPDGFQLGISSQGLQMELFVRAMRENGLLRILAEPNLVALSGQTAEFLAGGEFPVPVPQDLNVTIEWKDYGVKLEFTPTVIGRQMIRLAVAPEVSDVDFTNAVRLEGFTVPGVTQRRALTTIELASGSTIAIAGLLSENTRGLVHKIPALGDVPVLGSLFRSVEYQRDLTELVILVTPELVTSMHPDQIPEVPGTNLGDVSDWDLYAMGKLESDMPEKPESEEALETQGRPKYRKFVSPPEQTSLHGLWGAAEASEVVN